MSSRKPFRLPDTLTVDDFIKIVNAVPKTKPKHKLALMLGFFQCMRVSEVAGLKPEDIDKNRRLIHIRQAKGAKDRIIPIAPEVYKGLKHLPVGRGDRALQIMVKRYAVRALGNGYDWVHFHTLRHSGATYYLNKKRWSTRQLQRFLGHSKITTTEIYLHVNPEDLVNKMWGE